MSRICFVQVPVARNLITALMILSVTIGCGGGETGPERAEVEGQVTFDGEPVEKRSIAFAPVSGKGSPAGGTIENGEYYIDAEMGPTIGEFKVEIVATRGTGKIVPLSGLGDHLAQTKDELMEYYIPRKYNTATRLRAEIKSGTNTHDFHLEP